ncbi:hypothetical protein Ae201684P_001601 [Aphanomyces euteiches]|uniref:Secreted protein n=1 Tax=Aphanomyces euteiches TaxID=100861 RepID=A0A6G0X9U9_9STRA|nr:hypothetical protein Ae201684_007187 [Aphanomyces euteiches]KAH9052420.1 hypothetical protein Ae201684P_001601 [Aphanomyces euteiches]
MKTSSLILACVAANAARADDSTACLAKFTQVLQAGIVSTDVQQCVKDTGVSPTSPNLTEADLQKALAAPSCLKWWAGVVAQVKAIKPLGISPTRTESRHSTRHHSTGL